MNETIVIVRPDEWEEASKRALKAARLGIKQVVFSDPVLASMWATSCGLESPQLLPLSQQNTP